MGSMRNHLSNSGFGERTKIFARSFLPKPFSVVPEWKCLRLQGYSHNCITSSPSPKCDEKKRARLRLRDGGKSHVCRRIGLQTWKLNSECNLYSYEGSIWWWFLQKGFFGHHYDLSFSRNYLHHYQHGLTMCVCVCIGNMYMHLYVCIHMCMCVYVCMPP